MKSIPALTLGLATKSPVILWGSPGTGKTSAIEGIARAWGEPLETVIAAIREPSDFSGLPVVRKDGVTFEPPAWAKRLCESKKGILFFDEISCFPGHVPVTMADGTSKPIEEVCVGDYVKTFDTKNGRSSSNLVSNVILRTRSDLIRLTMDDGSTIETTPDHPFWSEGEWKHAKDILGREVCILPGLRRRETSVHVDRVHQVLRVESIESVPGTHTVYDITVENDHNFYADGILVHNCAPPATQAALLRVIFDRWVGDIQLPPDIRIVAAANPPEESAGGWDLPAPMANRFLHLDWTPYLAGWIEGMQSGKWLNGGAFSGKRIEGYEVHIPQCRVLVSAFVKAKPDLLLKVPTDAINAGRAWPSPRSWDMLARLWAAGRQGGANQDVMLEVARGCVGEGPGIEFVNWIRDLDLPDPEEVLANPKSFKLPKRGDQQYAVLSAIAHATISNLNPKRYIAAWEVMAIAAEEGAVDVACGAAKSLADAFVNDQSLPIPEKQVLPFKDLLKAAMVATS